MPTCKSTQLQFTVVIYSLQNGRQSCGLNALAYPIREVLLQTCAVLGLMVVRQSEPCSGKFTIRDRLEVIAGSRVSRSGAAATSKTTGWPPSAGCGPLRLPPTVSPPASTTASGGNRHAAANRHLFNKLLGQLYCCLQHGQTFDVAKAFSVPACYAAA